MVRAHTLTRLQQWCTEIHGAWAMERWMCLWSWHVTWRTGAEPLCSVSVKLPTHHPPPPPDPTKIFEALLELPEWQRWWQGTIDKERYLKPLSCQTSTSSHLQTAKVCFPQDSVDTVIGETTAVTMETILWRAGTVFRLKSERITGDAMVLAVYAGSGADHYCTFWTADSITAVTAGRLQTDKKGSGADPDMFSQLTVLCYLLLSKYQGLKIRNDQRGQKNQNTNSLKSLFKWMQTPLNPGLTQAGLESPLISWPGGPAVGPPHCHSYGVVSCRAQGDRRLSVQDRVNIHVTWGRSVEEMVRRWRDWPKNAEGSEVENTERNQK